jgi:23S rRNA pseudouridine1911/1915/1917 synthase
LEATGVIDARIGPSDERRDQMMIVERGGQRAVTRYALDEADDRWQLVRLWPETGRTHQLRVHLAHLGSPILGDRLYGLQPPRVIAASTQADRLHLHARRIELPAGEGYEARNFESPLPAGFWPVTKG